MVEVGSTIGNYEVLQKIGQGAMGAVYLAKHPVIGKRVALKVIHPELLSDEEMVSRFFNEARAVTQIGHAHVVDVQDFGQTPDGDSFIVMELLEGIGLGDLLKQAGPLPIERAVHIAKQLTDGISAAHARGIIHRDLKPDNIFLVRRGNDGDFVKILDFGLAKLTGPGAMSHKTRTGAVLGTAHYMAPEAGEDARKADHRVDVYALGCILFQMVIGRVPFPGEGFGEVLVRHVREPPPLPSRLRADVPAWLEKIILHALAKKADFRFATMEDFGRALRDPQAWERAFDDHELSEAELAAGAVRGRSAKPGDSEPQRVTPVRSLQVAADAKTISPVEAAAQQAAAQQAARAPTDGDKPRTEPSPPQTSQVTAHRDPSPRRGSGALGTVAAVIGAIAILAAGFYVARHVLYADVTLSVSTEPAGVEILVGASRVGTSPAQVKLRRSKTPVGLVLSKPGYVTVRRTIEPKGDLSLDVTLPAEVSAAPAAPTPAPSPSATPSPSQTPKATPAPTPAPTPRPLAAKRTDAPAAKRPPRKKKEFEFQQDGALLAPSF